MEDTTNFWVTNYLSNSLTPMEQANLLRQYWKARDSEQSVVMLVCCFFFLPPAATVLQCLQLSLVIRRCLCSDASYFLGLLSFYGHHVPKSRMRASHYFRFSAEKGHVGSQTNLGVMLANGLGIARNDLEAIYWFHRAAESNHMEAQWWLGKMYIEGRSNLPPQQAQREAFHVRIYSYSSRAFHFIQFGLFFFVSLSGCKWQRREEAFRLNITWE